MEERKTDYTKIGWVMCPECPMHEIIPKELITHDNRICGKSNKFHCNQLLDSFKERKENEQT